MLTFTVLAAGAARGVAVAGELVVRRWLAGVGMCRVRLIGEGVHHGPWGGPRERQWGQSVLVWGPTGAIIVIQRQVGHVCVGDKREEMNNARKRMTKVICGICWGWCRDHLNKLNNWNWHKMFLKRSWTDRLITHNQLHMLHIYMSKFIFFISQTLLHSGRTS